MGETIELEIDDGLQDFKFKNTRGEVFASFAFNPTDTHIIERYEDVVDYFDKYEMGDGENISEEFKKLNDALREKFNYLLNRNVSDGLFGTYAPTAVFANGDFYAEIALDKIGEFIEKATNSRIAKKRARIKKATAKYHK